MALDHYVSQIHLKQFNSPDLVNRFHAIRKSDLKYFTPRPMDVCRMEDGSTNSYLAEERAIEDFLKLIEPRYTTALQQLENDSLEADSIIAIAGFVAYILTCSPCAMRHQSIPMQILLEDLAKSLDQNNMLPPVPKELGNKSVTDLITDGTLQIAIDGKYPQALGISGILESTHVFANSFWEILKNLDDSSPFFSSDFPVVTSRASSRIASRIVPVSPNLAVRITPQSKRVKNTGDLSISGFSQKNVILSRSETIALNRLIVRAAESEVYFREDRPWVRGFVAKNAGFRTELIGERVRIEGQNYLHSIVDIQRII